MQIWASKRQYFRDGQRISHAMWNEIMARAADQNEIEQITHKKGGTRFRIKGVTANVYRYERHAGVIDWHSEMSKNDF